MVSKPHGSTVKCDLAGESRAPQELNETLLSEPGADPSGFASRGRHKTVTRLALHFGQFIRAEYSGEITGRLQITPGAAVLCVEDTGRAFDPTTPPCLSQPVNLLAAEAGVLGLVLLHHYCHGLLYERLNDRNRLPMRFALPPN
jgi:hypothetical protein